MKTPAATAVSTKPSMGRGSGSAREAASKQEDEACVAQSHLRMAASYSTPTSDAGWAYQAENMPIFFESMVDARRDGDERGCEEEAGALQRLIWMFCKRHAEPAAEA
jgi:hypothetical protein